MSVAEALFLTSNAEECHVIEGVDGRENDVVGTEGDATERANA
jgi:hypothetical protein